MADEPDESEGREPLSWRVRRWAAPVALAVSVAASITAVQLLVDDPVPSATSHPDDRLPRFMLKVGSMAGASAGNEPAPWFEVRAVGPDGRAHQVDSVLPPTPDAAEAQAILAGPEGTFVLTASRKNPCESRFYRFRLTRDGHVTNMGPLHAEAVPAFVAGLAMSPDGRRLAYTTAPCTDDTPQTSTPRASVTVLDIDAGQHRTWTVGTPSVIGEIVWARDNRTLGYTLSQVRPDAPLGPDIPPGHMHLPGGRAVQEVTMHALDTDARGTDLRAARVLFRRRASSSGQITTMVMNPDGRTGYGAMKKRHPPSTIVFSFGEGEPMRVTSTIPQKPNTLTAIAFSHGGDPRYACLNGLDSFGRVSDGGFTPTPISAGCGIAYAY